ncbi:hypothetical protein BAUCODRAFT_37418 [Baudoinia panamericana UAMH 10762]|uniref:Uncharacterized protein n=1 Tax=Baudoinia panamericana (strain UAMH 10762) TaxID=717646 RepID=M2N3V3_BAUPA|nr:uncharacterized protein BAUCODRAFT_37418 [Baudoinia panamericana UAMH 10762]EMC93699.1 hypothetical protein BAUCODRAFT_37418 [Baudoinia panamericana UAMH 10762]
MIADKADRLRVAYIVLRSIQIATLITVFSLSLAIVLAYNGTDLEGSANQINIPIMGVSVFGTLVASLGLVVQSRSYRAARLWHVITIYVVDILVAILLACGTGWTLYIAFAIGNWYWEGQWISGRFADAGIMLFATMLGISCVGVGAALQAEHMRSDTAMLNALRTDELRHARRNTSRPTEAKVVFKSTEEKKVEKY